MDDTFESFCADLAESLSERPPEQDTAVVEEVRASLVSPRHSAHCDFAQHRLRRRIHETTGDCAVRPGQVETTGDGPFCLPVIRTWQVEVVERTGSTNADLMARLRKGDNVTGVALIALEQEAGRGRLTRSWESPAGESVAVSVGVPMGADSEQWGLIPLMAGLAVARAVKDLGGQASLKWPNDVLLSGRKVCGILAESVVPTAVVGIGVNVGQSEATIGFPQGISLVMAGVDVSRAEVAAALLARLGEVFGEDEPRHTLHLKDYKQWCATIGEPVRVHLDATTIVEGIAVDVADDGRLVVSSGGRTTAYSSGDVYHLR